jgi:hypothetical protein
MTEGEKQAAKDRCYQEQAFFTGSAVAFAGFLGGLQSHLNWLQTTISVILVAFVGCLAFRLIVGRATYYAYLDNKPEPGKRAFWGQVCYVFREEKSGAMFCCVLTLATTLGVILLLFSKAGS